MFFIISQMDGGHFAGRSCAKRELLLAVPTVSISRAGQLADYWREREPVEPDRSALLCSFLYISPFFSIFFLSFSVCLPPFFPPSPIFFVFSWRSGAASSLMGRVQPLPRSAHPKWNYASGHPDAVFPSSCQTSRPPKTYESVGTAPANKLNAKTLSFVLKTRQPIH